MMNTVLWEHHGLEVYQASEPTGALVIIVLVARRLGHVTIAWSRTLAQRDKIEDNPERWARAILRRRLQTARARVLSCQRKRVDAQARSERWAEIAGRFGIQR